jgi:hypothetical protein
VAAKTVTTGCEADFMGNKDARRREIKKPKRKKLARENVNQAVGRSVKQAGERSQLPLAGVLYELRN